MRISPSIVTSWFIALFLTLTVFNLSRWKDRDVLLHDMYVYYSYLPATFIYDDLTFNFAGSLPPDDKRQIWTLQAPNGGNVQKMTMGMAMMYAPFFGVAHASAKVLGLPADGYSTVYHFFMAISALAYAILAIFVQRKLLLQYFSEKEVSLTLFAIALGTNFYYYTTSEGPMSHIHNFFLISVFIWQILKWLHTFRWMNGLIAALALGLIVLIRPVNAIVVLIPLLYGVRSFAELMYRFKEVFTRYFQLLFMLLVIGAVLFPQLLYWHTQTGDWIYYSYNDEGFFFNDPRILEGLFSFRKGWLLYAPIMGFSMLGLLVLWGRNSASKFRLAIPVYLALHLYIVFSWWCWWYGGSFGARPMVDAAAILSIPMAAMFSLLLRHKNISIATMGLVLAFVGLNLWQSMQYRHGLLHWDSMTKETYIAIFGRQHYPEGYAETIKTPDYDAAKKGDRDE